MEVSGCLVILLAIPVLLAVGGIGLGVMKLIDVISRWEKKPTPPTAGPMTTRITYLFKKAASPAASVLGLVLAVGVIWLVGANVTVVDCNNKERAALGMEPQPVKVAGVSVPCPCGCGKHK